MKRSAAALCAAAILLAALAGCAGRAGSRTEVQTGQGQAASLTLPTGSGTPPEAPPDGTAPQGTPPAAPPNGGFGGSGAVNQGTAASTIDADGNVSGTSYTSAADDQNALRVQGVSVALNSIVVEKSGGASSNTEDGDFYGLNAALLATGGAQVTLTGATVTSAATNGNGVFSYGEGTAVTIRDSQITTTGSHSGGIQTAGGGSTEAQNLTVQTAGSSSAAIRSDRGGGTVTVEGGSYTTTGLNSPAVYSTAQITVANAALSAQNSEALVVEGANALWLQDCTVAGNMSAAGASANENIHTVMIYQSMSGDAAVGSASFAMQGGSLTGTAGDLFYVTNTHCRITLSGVQLSQRDHEAALLRVAGNSGSRGWGTAGANGGQVELTASRQALYGDIVVDDISQLALTLADGSTLEGSVNIAANEWGGEATGQNVHVAIAAGCSWTLTANSTITTLDNQGVINFNGYTLTLADGTVLRS